MNTNRTHSLLAVVAAIATTLAMGSVQAQQASAPSASASSAMGTAPAGKSTLSRADQKFMTEAAGAGMYEVEVSKLVADHSENADLKSFAQMLITDHTAANTELMGIAQTKNVSLPPTMPKSKQSEIDKLAKLKGDAFDKAFIQQAGLKAHREAVSLFDGESKSGKDADVKGFATKILPKLREHLAAAQGMSSKTSSHMAGAHAASAPRP